MRKGFLLAITNWSILWLKTFGAFRKKLNKPAKQPQTHHLLLVLLAQFVFLFGKKGRIKLLKKVR